MHAFVPTARRPLEKRRSEKSPLIIARALIRVHVFDEQASFAPYACLQCSEAWCMKACPVNAIAVDDQTGAKIVIDEVCVGCKLCVIACPFGTIFFDKGSDKATKCDLCAGDPACARACPTGAISVAGVDPGAWLVDFGKKVDSAYRVAVDGLTDGVGSEGEGAR